MIVGEFFSRTLNLALVMKIGIIYRRLAIWDSVCLLGAQLGVQNCIQGAIDRKLQLLRTWGIENRLHWVCDVTFAEDASRRRPKSALHIFSALRNVSTSCRRSLRAINLLGLGEKNEYIDSKVTKSGGDSSCPRRSGSREEFRQITLC